MYNDNLPNPPLTFLMDRIDETNIPSSIPGSVLFHFLPPGPFPDMTPTAITSGSCPYACPAHILTSKMMVCPQSAEIQGDDL